MYEIKICHLYPDLLNLYGDRGNVISLKKRCEWRGIGATVSNISLGGEFVPWKYDIVILGGGQDFEQETIRQDVVCGKGEAIKAAIEDGVVFLCVCGGYQILGRYFLTNAGKKIEFLNALDFYTVAGNQRLVGNMAVECSFLGNGGKGNSLRGNGPIGSGHRGDIIIGFENHSGRTYLGPSLRPLGRVLKGYGNNGEDSFEGVVYKNTFCSYIHGSLLPKNPRLADHLISTVLKRKYGDQFLLDELDDSFENTAHDSMLLKMAKLSGHYRTAF